MTNDQASGISVQLLRPADLSDSVIARLDSERASLLTEGEEPSSLRWLSVFRAGLQHEPYCVVARDASQALVGVLPLAFVKSWLFGKFLVSLPYINSAGVWSKSPAVNETLITAAGQLADELDVRYLELRQEVDVEHALLGAKNESKVIMRMPLPDSPDALWTGFKSKLRSQIKSGQKHEFEVAWGGVELLPEFYHVFSRNMRDLGTPVFSPGLFQAIMQYFPNDAEFCVLRLAGQAVGAALLYHSSHTTEVPSASTLREFNSTSANMVMYWHLLERAVVRKKKQFDFGRSTLDGSTFRFKKQWGAEPCRSVWQYYVRRGSVGDMRPQNGKFGLAIRVWQRLPVALTRWLGPGIVRGIP